MTLRIEPLQAAPETCAALAAILVDVVAAGGSVGFMHPLSPAAALAFWTESLAKAGRGERIVLGAWNEDVLAGTVTLLLDFPPNQPHRCELAKMMTRPAHRGRGIATALVRRAEALARAHRKTLIVLDTAAEGGASGFYEGLGYMLAGSVPDFALLPHGGLTPTRFYWKRIGAEAG